MIGILTVMPLYSRTDTRQLHSVVEKALQKYSRMINRQHDKIGWVEEARTVIGVPNGERAATVELTVR